MCNSWPADPERGHKGPHVGLLGPSARKFRAQLLGRRGVAEYCPGLATSPLGQLGTLDTPPGQLHTLTARPHSDLGSVLLFFASCVRVWPWRPQWSRSASPSLPRESSSSFPIATLTACLFCSPSFHPVLT